MRTLTLASSHTLDLYHTLHELPAHRHTEFRCRLAQQDGIGATMADANTRFTRLSAFIAAGRIEDATEELAHLHYTFGFMLDKYDPRCLAFACLIARVDGEPLPAVAEEEAQLALIEQLSDWGLSYGMVSDTVNEVRSQLDTEGAHSFAHLSGEAQELAVAQQRKRRLLASLALVLTQGENPPAEKAVLQVRDWLLAQQRPDIFDDGHPQNAVLLIRRGFGLLCAQLAEAGIPHAGELSMFALHAHVAYLLDKQKPTAE